MRILCIEDNDEKFDMIKKLLQSNKKIELIWAKTGNEGLLKLSKEKFEMLILDMSLPINAYSKNTNMLYGEEVLAEIRRMRSRMKVFVITGFDIFEQHNEKLTFEELYKRLQANYKKNFVEMVRYDQLSIEWAVTLEKVVKEIENDDL